jgi:hypothetical protein
MASKDDNAIQPLYGVSHIDGITPVQVKFNAQRGMMVDTITTIQFDPLIDASRTNNDLPLAKAVSITDNQTIRPWVVHATTGAVLIET